jgi:guanylate kinase
MLKSRAIVISSVSGGGKTTIINRLREKYPFLRIAVTATTRVPRKGEIDGVHYHFFSRQEFEVKIEKNEFLEYAVVHGNYYGIPYSSVSSVLESGDSVILNIDVQGMLTVKERLRERVITFFIMPPDQKVWEERLRNRKLDSEEDILLRLEDGRREMEMRHSYDHVIVNDDLEDAVESISEILRRHRVLIG